MKKIVLLFVAGIAIHVAGAQQRMIAMSKAALKDKIMGGWAGQTIGVTFGGPYEFRYDGTFIGDDQPLLWRDGYLRQTMLNDPGLYDDLYMDLTFVQVIDNYGLDAPVDSFASAYAHAGYTLWHANQAGRYNILNGLRPPQSGSWMNNPHADDIDYQIESDFAGLMSPGMPNSASKISDKIGHIMNSGDGWYGGVFVGAMYAEAFISDDIDHIVNMALTTIPSKSQFAQCIRDVIGWHKQFPDDWKRTWFEVQKKWANETGCPEGVFAPFNIDAKVNAAYVVIGLLYGHKDFTRSLEIATRCGQDADCNPSTVGGVLGALLGYEHIPAYWKMGLKEAEDIDFKYTTMNLRKTYEIGTKHALKNIEMNGGRVVGDSVHILIQQPATVQFETNFAGHYPVSKITGEWSADSTAYQFNFTGNGFVLKGEMSPWNEKTDFAFHTALYIDDKLIDSAILPVSYTTRRYDLCWKYQLPVAQHHVVFKILNPSQTFKVNPTEVIVYSNKPVNGMAVNVR